MSNDSSKTGVTTGRTYLDAFLNSKDRLIILERAVESARNGIVITDPNLPDNPIVYANRAFIELTGYHLNDILGKNCRFLQGDDSEQEGLSDIRQAVREQKPCMTLLRNYKKDGTLFWNELSVSPVFDADANLINFIGVQNDVTSRKEAETKVSEFYSMVSHELRTPLTSIRASLELIDDGSAGIVPPQVARLARIALNNSQRLLKLVNDILDMKRAEAGKLQLNFGMVHPDDLINEVIVALEDLAKAENIQIIKRIQTKKSFCGDHSRMAQVLTNLVANAIKFSPTGSEVCLSAEQDGSAIRIAVTDRGKGISDLDQEKLFQKFQQLDSSDTREHTGSGLGLAICKLIVELHGGQIGVESEPGKGSAFWISIPCVPKD